MQPPDEHRFKMWQTTGRNDGEIRRQVMTSGKLASPEPPTDSQASHPSDPSSL
jgi:hypothetical protein